MCGSDTSAKYDTKCLGGVAGFSIRNSGAPDSTHDRASAKCCRSISSIGRIAESSDRTLVFICSLGGLLSVNTTAYPYQEERDIEATSVRQGHRTRQFPRPLPST